MKIEDASACAEATGGTLWVNYDLYIYPEYKIWLWAQYLWKRLRGALSGIGS